MQKYKNMNTVAVRPYIKDVFGILPNALVILPFCIYQVGSLQRKH